MKREIIVVAVALLAGCSASAPPEVLQQWRNTARFTCCNLHYENPSKLTDANYFVGTTLPFGSAVGIEDLRDRAMTFRSNGIEFTLTQVYGTGQESAQQFFGKVFVDRDPRVRFAEFPAAVRNAITDGRVEVGMTREQVLMSLGHPPTHRTVSLDSTTWTYWYNRWLTYQVQFDVAGHVSGVVGSRAPTRGEPVAPAPRAAAEPAHR